MNSHRSAERSEDYLWLASAHLSRGAVRPSPCPSLTPYPQNSYAGFKTKPAFFHKASSSAFRYFFTNHLCFPAAVFSTS